MKKIVFALGIAAALGVGVQPALAQCTTNPGCPETAVCVNIPANSSPNDMADCIRSNWNLTQYACNDISATPNGVTVIATETGGTREIVFQVPAGVTQNGFDFVLRLGTPLGAASSPFDILVNYDNQGELLIRDGTTSFEEIDMVVSTQIGGGAGLPAIGTTGTLLFIVGLLAAGVAIIMMRRV